MIKLSSRIPEIHPALIFLLPQIYSFTLMWWIPEGDKYVPGMIVALLLFFLVGNFYRFETKFDRFFKILLVAVWLLVFYQLSIYFIKGDSWREVRAILTMAIYLSIFGKFRYRSDFFKPSLIFSAFSFFVLTFYFYFSGESRVGGFINPIPYATVLGSLFLLLLSIAIFERDKKQKFIIFSVCAALFFAVLMTKTRGVILPVLIIAPAIIIFRAVLLGRLKLVIVSILLCVFFAAGASFLLKDRVNATFKEMQAIETGDESGSIGLRLQMWDAGVAIWLKKPLFGWGSDHIVALDKMYEEGKVRPSLYHFNPPHYHDQYIDILVKRGVFGLALFVLVIFSVINLTLRIRQRGLRWGGISSIVLYLLAGITDVPYHHPNTVYFFFSLVLGFSIFTPAREESKL